ncbi:phage integrase family protein [Paraburkholderia sp. J63]|uniref:phage integrase family protein n=1 Tax=Paraburkholderia sp. J63 TaxID=2805434 RepID=UPI002ABD4FC4|nr:phage integrase family protein [Paraburkholderia sp. J63]
MTRTATPHPGRPLLLTRADFALYRAWLEGVDDTALHASYGTAGTDVQITRRQIVVIRDTLSAAARRARDTDAAHLLRLKPGSLRDQLAAAGLALETGAPSLEDWREQIDPDGFYAEAELLALYRDAYPAQAPAPERQRLDRKLARNARLRQRQAAALARMEATLALDPQPEDPLDTWFDARLAARLAAAGLATLADLLALIRRRRQRWYAGVPRLGEKGARRVLDWLDLHAATLGVLSPLATTPRRQLPAGHPALLRPPVAAEVVPLEALRVPHELDGSQGLNRAPVPAHQAALNTDLEAVTAWIDIRGARSAHTRRAYRREAERLLLWALVVKGKPLSSLNTRDCAGYVDEFLRDPQPAQRWVGRSQVERFDPDWRPFAGPLSDRSRHTARAILKSMCAWLVGERYLLVNPFAGLPAIDTGRAPIDTAGRTLTHAQWAYVLQTVQRPLASPTCTAAEHRDYFALLFAYATGLRRAELAAASVGRLSRKALDGALDDAWTLQVDGKGRRLRTVPMPRGLMDALRTSLHQRAVPVTLEAAPPATPLLAHLGTGRPLSASMVGALFKRVFVRAADQLEGTYPGAAADLRRASTHWLRHTHSNHALDAGGDVRDVQAGLGHASLATTTLYTKADNARRFALVDRLFNAAVWPDRDGLPGQ